MILNWNGQETCEWNYRINKSDVKYWVESLNCLKNWDIEQSAIKTLEQQES